MNKTELIDRLSHAHPGWPIFDELIKLVASLDFELIKNEYLGEYLVSGSRLVFAAQDNIRWPGWLPSYVGALNGMNADYYEMAGRYADLFSGEKTKEGALFSPIGNDEDLGFPLISVPDNIFPFQSNYCGAVFHIDKELQILIPDADTKKLIVLDTLEEFTKKNIQQVLKNQTWFEAYSDLDFTLID